MWSRLTVFLILSIFLSACGGGTAPQGGASTAKFKAVYVSTGPIGTNPFLQLIAQGLTKAGTDCGVKTKVVESTDVTNMQDNFRTAIAQGNDLIVANSFDSVDAITLLSKQYPNQKWALVDQGIPTLPNVRGVVFRENEGMFLVGAAMGLLATGNYPPWPKSDAIGLVGAIDIPLIRNWYVGFSEGIKNVNPSVQVLQSWGNSFTDPATSKELALAQFNKGAKYIAAVSAAGNSGIFAAAKEKGFFTSGGDTDQRSIDPQHIIISMVKRTDVGVYDAVCDLAKDKFTGGNRYYSVAQKGNGPEFVILDKISPPSSLPQEVRTKVVALSAQIVSGRIKVTDYLATHS